MRVTYRSAGTPKSQVKSGRLISVGVNKTTAVSTTRRGPQGAPGAPGVGSADLEPRVSALESEDYVPGDEIGDTNFNYAQLINTLLS